MFARLRSHLTYANVTATLALFLALGGGAYAVTTAKKNSVTSKSIKAGAVTGPKLRADAVDSSKVQDGSLGDADINEASLVGVNDTCPSPATARFGRICAGAPPNTRDWPESVAYCAGLGLRLPTVGEAEVLALGFDVPQVASMGFFWTDGNYFADGVFRAAAVSENGDVDHRLTSGQLLATVCVADPSDAR